MNIREELIEALSLGRWGKGYNNDGIINLFDKQAKKIINEFEQHLGKTTVSKDIKKEYLHNPVIKRGKRNGIKKTY